MDFLLLLLLMLLLCLLLLLLLLLPACDKDTDAFPGQLHWRTPLPSAMRRRKLELTHLRLKPLHPHLDLVELRNAINIDRSDEDTRRATPGRSRTILSPPAISMYQRRLLLSAH